MRLDEKKERLVKAQDYEKWLLDSEGMAKIAQLKNNEKMAKEYMLPKESAIVEEKKNLLNFYSNQVKHQVTDMLDNNYVDLSEHLMDYAWEQKKISSKSIDNWNNLFEHFKDLDIDQYDDKAEPREGAKEEDKEEVKQDIKQEKEKNGHLQEDPKNDSPDEDKKDVNPPENFEEVPNPPDHPEAPENHKEEKPGDGPQSDEEYDMANPFE